MAIMKSILVGTTTLLWTLLLATTCLGKQQQQFVGGGGGRGGRNDAIIRRRRLLSFGTTTNHPLLASSLNAVVAASSSLALDRIPRGGGGGGGGDKNKNTKKAAASASTTASFMKKVTPRRVSNNNNKKETKSTSPCSGDDGNVIVAYKTAGSVILQTLGLLTVMKLAQVAPKTFFPQHNDDLLPKVFGLPLLQFLASIFIIFSSSTVKSWIQGGVIGAATNQVLKPSVVPGDMNWYQQLKKPWFNPPGYVFPIMWLLVSKPTQLIALIRILKLSNEASSSSNLYYWSQLVIYCTHLSLGDAWNNVFFDCQRIGLGAYIIITFFGMLLTSALLFYMVDEMAGLLMLPTCAWVTVATLLNIRIYQLNKK